MTDRRGYTLVETMVVITTSGMLAVLGVTTVSRLIQVERSGTRDVAESTVLRQLSLRFRADVHAARDAGLPDALPDRNPRASVDLREPGNRSVTWSLDPRGLVRRERRRTAGDDDSETRQLFRLDGARAAFGLLRQPGSSTASIVTLHITLPRQRGPRDIASRPRVTRIDAALGLNTPSARPHPSPGTDEP